MAFWKRLLLLGLVFAWAVAAIVVAAVQLGGEPTDDVAAVDRVTVLAEMGTVERRISLNAVLAWDQVGVLLPQTNGIITSLAADPLVGEGDSALSIDLVDVVVAEGSIPMFRDLRVGTVGPDVAQLQAMLARAGMYTGEADGEFGASTRRAVIAWQEGRGLEATGGIAVGDLVFVKDLPVRLDFADSAVVGSSVSSDEEVAGLTDPEPRFVVPVQETQTTLVEVGMVATIALGDTELSASVTGMEADLDSGEPLVEVSLDEPCLDRCSSLGASDEERYPVEIELVPTTAGVIIPSLALIQTGDGRTKVELDSGELVEVVELAAAGGRSVVEGIEAGDEVVVIGGLG